MLTIEKNRDLDIRSYIARVMEELKDPEKRQTKTDSKSEVKKDEASIDIDEADYVPAKANGMTVLVSGGDEDSGSMPTAQREIILKEIAAFRERSNRRERNKTWYEEEEKARNERDSSPVHSESRGRNRGQDAEDKRGARSASVHESIPSGPAADRRRGGREYHQAIRFKASSDRYDREDDDDIPDDELESRRQDRKRRDLEAAFGDV